MSEELNPIGVHDANVFLPGSLGPVRREVVLAYEHDRVVEQLNAELATLKAWQGEAVAWVIEDDDGSQPRLARLKHPLPPVGTKLYTAPPATGVIVPRELLERVLSDSEFTRDEYSDLDQVAEELRALLARQEVNS